MFNALQNPLALSGRLLFALLFLPAGISKISGFAGTVGYITSAGLPLRFIYRLCWWRWSISCWLMFWQKVAHLSLSVKHWAWEM